MPWSWTLSMSFTGKKDSKRRPGRQLCASREVGDDDILDISARELAEVPSSAFSTCRDSRKKALILHGNKLKSLLPKGCDIGALSSIMVLDLHGNMLKCLPDDLGTLSLLQVLNVSKNQLESLPDSIGDLRLLQTLDVRANRLAELPSSVGCLNSLRILDLSGNAVRRLPKSLGHVRTLESLTLDAGDMLYPPAGVCAGGTEDVQRFLCAELGEEYRPPSLYLLPVLGSNNTSGSDHSQCNVAADTEQALQSKFEEYNKRKERMQKEMLAAECRLAEEVHKEQAQLLLASTSRREDVLRAVRREQQCTDQGVSQQQKAQEANRLSLMEAVRRVEDGLGGRIDVRLMDADRHKRSAEALRAMEEDRIRVERVTAVTQEEAASLRKKEVAAAMQQMLSDGRATDLLQEASDRRRRDVLSEACKSAQSLDRALDLALSLRQVDKSRAVERILEEDELQKAAFEALQLKKDGAHSYIRLQIGLVEARLMQLSKLERKRHNADAEDWREALGRQRTDLGRLLQQLLKQKDEREAELKQQLAEMERAPAAGLQNYWMLQYQRLLESKPSELRELEAAVDPALVSLLSALSAQHYLPVLAHHRVAGGEALRHMSESDLGELGIGETGVRRALLDWAKQQHDGVKATQQPRTEEEEATYSSVSTSPPPPYFLQPNTLPEHGPMASASSPAEGAEGGPTEGQGGYGECVVCMDAAPQVVFLPCGHVCCCRVCGGSGLHDHALRHCPLCRSNIAQRIRLYHP